MGRTITVEYQEHFEGDPKEVGILIWDDNYIEKSLWLSPAEANELQINLESLLVGVGKELNNGT